MKPSRRPDPLLFLIVALITIYGFIVPAPARADISAYVGVGPALIFPGTIRVGYENWEAGLLTAETFGVDEVFRFNWKYVAWGLAASDVGTWGAGFYGAAGLEPHLFWALTFRAELNAVAISNGFVKGEAYAGLGLHF